MIQRIQTLYLALGVVALLCTFFFSEPLSSLAAETYAWFSPAVIGLIGLTSITTLYAISLYTSRKKQRSVVVGAQVLTVLYIVVLYTGMYLSGELVLRTSSGPEWERTVVLLLPVVAYILFYLARRAISSDIELVESMDRLR